MKQYGNFKLGVLLLASAGLASCSSDDTFSGSKGQSGEPVKTQFAISVPVGKSGRLSQDIVQGQSPAQFRGMDNIRLIPFSTAPVAGGSGDVAPIALGSILDNELAAGTNAKVYYEVQIPEHTSHFLFYGEAYSANDDAKTNGALTANVEQAINNISFSLKPISTDAENDAEATTLLAALNLVAQSQDESNKTWANAGVLLKAYYDAFTSLKAGSANSIKMVLNELYESIDQGDFNIGDSNLEDKILKNINSALASIGNCTYPQNVGLPDGAAQLKFEGGAFSYINSENIGNLSYTSMDRFVYPASLYYMANTDIKTADTRLSDQYSTNWETCLGLYNPGGTSVTATTQSVALVDPVKYAVGRFDVAAKFSASSINDNVGNSINVEANNGMTLDGILIGGQKNADWQFAPLASSEEYTIYDASVTSTKLGTADIASAIMAQSLALSTTAGTNVNFALELTNNTGNAFTGVDGIVPSGAKFYLVGRLEPQADKADNQVFAQAYNTKANVTITSLAHAYNCIPDLKNPKLELGLSVSLEWTEGLVQDITID
jgi:hypothetical protein